MISRSKRWYICLTLISTLILTACGSSDEPQTAVMPEAASIIDIAAEPAAADMEEAARPWMIASLTDVQTQETFTLADFKDKVVVVEAMAIWCPNCTIQQFEMAEAAKLLGDKAVFVSLDVDTRESADILADYAKQLGWSWHFALADDTLVKWLIEDYSPGFLNPPATPVLLIGPNLETELLPNGLKTADVLVEQVNRLLRDA